MNLDNLHGYREALKVMDATLTASMRKHGGAHTPSQQQSVLNDLIAKLHIERSDVTDAIEAYRLRGVRVTVINTKGEDLL